MSLRDTAGAGSADAARKQGGAGGPRAFGTAVAAPPAVVATGRGTSAGAGAGAGAGGSTSASASASAGGGDRPRRGSSIASASTAATATAGDAATIRTRSLKSRQATAATGNVATSSSPSNSSVPAPTQQCPQCRDLQTNFYCVRCLSSQLRAYQQRVGRVRDLCSGARDRIAVLLGPVPYQLGQGRTSLASASSTTYASRPDSPEDHPMAATITLRPVQPGPNNRDPGYNRHQDYTNSYASDLADPFGDPGSDYSRTLSGTSSTIPSPSTQRSLPPILPHRYAQHSQATHVVRTVRAERTDLLRKLEEARLSLKQSRQSIAQLQLEKANKRITLDRRRNNLHEAKTLLQTDGQRRGSKGEGAAQEVRNSRIALGRRNQDRAEDLLTSDGSGGLGCDIADMESEVKVLRRETKLLATELSRTRAILARETFSLFLVAPTAQTPSKQPARHGPGWAGLGSSPLSFLPDSMPAAFASPLRRPGVEGRLTAAGLRQGNSFPQAPSMQQAPGATPASTNTTITPGWTIVSLPLASPVEVRKYSREDINGALSYTSLLLQLLSAYLGVSMPFIIESQKGRNIIMPNELWNGSYTKEHIIQLTESAYDDLKSLGPAMDDRNIDPNAGSAFGLGSALSVLESFVQLPSTARLTSMLGPSGSDGTYGQPLAGSLTASGMLSNRTQGGGGEATGAASNRSAAVDEYVTVISMLSYNAAYLAHVQNVRVDLVAAATSPLAVLERAMSSKKLGASAHGTYAADAHIRNLSRNDMDWNQFRLVLDPYRGGGVGVGGGAASVSTAGTRTRATGLAPSRSKGAAGSGAAVSMGTSKGEFSTRTRRVEKDERGGEDDWDVVDSPV
ncbi:unnamed protein product [Tilletia laevis]|uniref:Uncharacterized protein n=2 Tax=Tilletia TaxID=13289 RepID=A0A177VDS5_9BASI|nr:hypothetical protein CF335_g5391 [Tilletia laevis]KAE8204802.1 hypothetical protein CF328_g874 [Tilletia controversa]KAE8264942.1 hypothetical protein A4X03_0g595 [Tilletia caries]KAE8200016.1 hypothetical protein CF336_g920 [Tilletia laevis]CAD6888744.1 unnamed protein product [Tilletia caries]